MKNLKQLLMRKYDQMKEIIRSIKSRDETTENSRDIKKK